MWNKGNKKIAAAVAVVVLAAASLSTAVRTAAESNKETTAAVPKENAAVKNKNEVIYANMDAEGTIQGMYAVNHFELSRGGTITDYGTYDTVTNLTDMEELVYADSSVTIQTEADDFYYQGNLSTKDAPWKFEITYWLDGSKVLAEEAAGKSGDLEIKIKTTQNTKIDDTFYEHYMLQITVTLNNEKCTNIKADGATTASAGKSTVLAFTVMPGRDADIALSSTVQKFEMAGIEISALPFSMDMDLGDTDELVAGFDELISGIADLNKGVGELKSGVKEMNSGAGELKSGSAEIQSGLKQLSDNSGQLTEGSAQINQALAQIAAALDGDLTGELDLGALLQLPAGLRQLSGGLTEISSGLGQLRGGYAQAYEALDQAINAIPEGTLGQDEIMALYGEVDPAYYAVLTELAENYAAAQTVKGTYAYIKEAFAAVMVTLDEVGRNLELMAGTLNDTASQINGSLSEFDLTSQLTELVTGMTQLSENYAQFHKGLQTYADGVTEMSGGYSEFHKGLSAFGDGVGSLESGIAELHDGTQTLEDGVSDLPELIEDEMESMVEEYTGGEFEMISFTSEKNVRPGLVQFVFVTDPVAAAEAAAEAAEEEEVLTFWDRLVALFK